MPTIRARRSRTDQANARRHQAYALGLALFFSLGSTLGMAREWKVAKIATDGASPPFVTLDSARQAQGFEIEIVRSVCERARIKCDFVVVDTENLLTGLAGRKFDAVASAQTITDELRKKFDTSDKYYSVSPRFLVSRTARYRNTLPETFKSRTIGVRANTLEATFLTEVYKPKGALIRLYPRQDEMAAELSAGKIDAIFVDPVMTYDWLSRTDAGRCCEFLAPDAKDPKFWGEGIGLVLRKTDGDLKAQWNKALGEILRDGTYERINRQHFPVAVY